MSDNIDRRIVEMRFDNEQFEKNVGQTLITLETLQKALEMSGASKGLEEVNKAAGRVDLSGVQNGVEQTAHQFSALEVMAVTALANITNSAVNAGKRLMSSFISPLVQGGKERAQNMAQAKFMFEGFQYSAEQIGSASEPGTILGEVYKSVEGTFYSLDKAALVASQFLATGMGVDELQKNLKGVAGVASVFGADYQRVGEIFGKVRTQGKLMGQDLMSLNTMGVPTIAKITEYLNKDLPDGAKKTQEEVSAMVSKGKIDFDTFAGAMEWAFGAQAAKSKKLFSGAVEDMRAAMARIGEKFWAPMLEVARDFFNASVPLIDNFSAMLSDAGVYDSFANSMAKVGEKITFVLDVLSALLNYDETLNALKGLVSSEVIDNSRVERLEKYKDKIDELRETLGKIFAPLQRLFSALKQIISASGSGLWSVFKTLGSGLGAFLNVVADGAEHISNSGDKVVSFFQRLHDALAPLAKGIFQSVQRGLEGIKKTLSGLNLGRLIIDAGFGAIGVAIWNVVKTIASFARAIKESGLVANLGLGTMFNEFRLSLIGLQTTLKIYQSNLKANILLKIAGAILALAVAVKILSTIPAAGLASATTAIAYLFASLVASSRLMKPAATRGIITMALAIAILAGAVKKLADVQNMGQGLKGVAALLGEIAAFCFTFSKLKIKPKSFIKTGLGLILIAEAIRMLVKPVNELGNMDAKTLNQGLKAIGEIMLGFVAFAAALKLFKPTALIKSGASVILIASGLRLLVKPIKELGSLNPKQLAQGLKSIGLALLEMVGYSLLMGKIASSGGSIIKAGLALVLMATGVKIMAGALDTMSNISEAGKGLSVLFGSLVILAGAMLIMQNALPGAAAMIIVAAALTVMAPAIALLSSLNIAGVGVGLLALAGTIAIFAGAAILLAPVIPLMLALGAAFGLLGFSILAIGAGMTMLAASFAVGITPIVDGVIAISEALPAVLQNLAVAIGAFLEMLAEQIPKLVPVLQGMFEVLMEVAIQYIPQLAKIGLDMIIALLEAIDSRTEQITILALDIVQKFIDGVAAKADDLAESGMNLILQFLNGTADAIANNGPLVMNAIESLVLSILETLVSALPIFGDKAAAAIEEYRKGLDTGRGGVVNSAKKTSTAVSKNLKIDDKAVKEYGKPLLQLEKQIDDSGKSASKKSKQMAKDTGSAMKIPSQTSNGANAVKGLISGISSQIPALKRKADEVGGIVDKVVRDKNKIKSPSRVLAETGKYMMMGLIQGIDSLTPAYQNRAENIATMMITSADQALNAMGSFSAPDLTSAVTQTTDVNLRMTDIQRENEKLANGLSSLTKSLNSMTDTMNSRSLNNYINVDGAADPEAFADGLIRSFRLNARTI